MSFLIAVTLLGLPVYAAHRLGAAYHWIALYTVMISAATYWIYAVDKRRAEEGLWRVPEANLHLLELLGGWPGAFLAQRRLRHKCSKGSYQFGFWLIVLVWQFAAYDSCQNWRCTHAAVNFIEHAPDHRR
jgi:uncharacterized membrane protein YsdA (DUF1294 family)